MKTTIRLPPGPKGLPLLGSLPVFMRDPLAFHQRMARDYFGVAFVRFGPLSLYIVSDPALVETLLVGKHRDCVKDMITRELGPLVGKGLITNDGDNWRRQRKLAAPPFAPKQIAAYADVMVASARRAFAAYAPHQQRDFHRDIMALTLEIVGKTLLGFDPEAESERVAQAMEHAIPYFEERLFSLRSMLPRAWHLPSAATRRFQHAKRELDDVVHAIIARARASDDGDYLLARLIRARDDDGAGMSEEQLADEALTILLAGHETTALSVMFAVYLLARDPDAARVLRAELDAQIGKRALRYEDLSQLPFLEAVVKETLRLYPAAPLLGREVAVPIELGGYEIERGRQIFMSPYAMQRNPRFFGDADDFRPARWLDGSSAELPKFAYFPFGGGPRICIGQHFALMEAQLLLGSLVQQVELTVPESFRMELQPVITLRSRHGLPVRVQRRAHDDRIEPAAARSA